MSWIDETVFPRNCSILLLSKHFEWPTESGRVAVGVVAWQTTIQHVAWPTTKGIALRTTVPIDSMPVDVDYVHIQTAPTTLARIVPVQQMIDSIGVVVVLWVATNIEGSDCSTTRTRLDRIVLKNMPHTHKNMRVTRNELQDLR